MDSTGEFSHKKIKNLGFKWYNLLKGLYILDRVDTSLNRWYYLSYKFWTFWGKKVDLKNNSKYLIFFKYLKDDRMSFTIN